MDSSGTVVNGWLSPECILESNLNTEASLHSLTRVLIPGIDPSLSSKLHILIRCGSTHL